MSVIYKEGQYYGKEVAIDNALNATSENPVQNKVVTHVFDRKADLENGKVPVSQLPSYVDDVIEGYYNETDGKFYEDDQYTTEITGEAGKIYVSIDTNHSYRWTGSIFTRIDQEECNESIDQTSFDNLPQSEKDNGTAYFVRDASVVRNFTVLGNRFDKSNIYTTDEKLIGSWMGKPLYKKTVNFGQMPNNNVKTVAHNISDMDAVVDFEASCWRSSDGYATKLPAVTPEGINSAISFNVNNTNIVMWSKADYTTFDNSYVTIWYTKSTDGQVKIGTGNDYSTDEMIIGTWIDGKKLYQKTVDFGALPNSTTKTVAHGISNIDKVVELKGFAQSSSSVLGQPLPLVYENTNVAYNSSLSIDATNIQIVETRDRSMMNAYVTVQYTKTTD